jgi:hypothetical protein
VAEATRATNVPEEVLPIDRGLSVGCEIEHGLVITVLVLAQRSDTIVVPPMPSTRAAPLDRSMHRPLTNGPRSFIRTVTARPVEYEVTVT